MSAAIVFRLPLHYRRVRVLELEPVAVRPGLRINEHLDYAGDIVFRRACKMGLEGIVSKRLGSYYRSGRTRDWLKFKNPEAPAVKRRKRGYGNRGIARGFAVLPRLMACTRE